MAIDIYIFCFRTSGICSNRTGIATAEDTVIDIYAFAAIIASAAIHRDVGIAEHICLITAAIDCTTFTTGILINGNAFKVGCAGVICGTDVHGSVIPDLTQVTAAKDFTVDVSA